MPFGKVRRNFRGETRGLLRGKTLFALHYVLVVHLWFIAANHSAFFSRFPYRNASSKLLTLFDAMDVIVNDPAPRLEGAQSSKGAFDFVARCLQKEPGARASAAELLQHPWLACASDLGALLSS